MRRGNEGWKNAISSGIPGSKCTHTYPSQKSDSSLENVDGEQKSWRRGHFVSNLTWRSGRLKFGSLENSKTTTQEILSPIFCETNHARIVLNKPLKHEQLSKLSWSKTQIKNTNKRILSLPAPPAPGHFVSTSCMYCKGQGQYPLMDEKKYTRCNPWHHITTPPFVRGGCFCNSSQFLHLGTLFRPTNLPKLVWPLSLAGLSYLSKLCKIIAQQCWSSQQPVLHCAAI